MNTVKKLSLTALMACALTPALQGMNVQSQLFKSAKNGRLTKREIEQSIHNGALVSELIKAQDENGKTLAHYAHLEKDIVLIGFLASLGDSMNILDKEGKKPADYLSQSSPHQQPNKEIPEAWQEKSTKHATRASTRKETTSKIYATTKTMTDLNKNMQIADLLSDESQEAQTNIKNYQKPEPKTTKTHANPNKPANAINKQGPLYHAIKIGDRALVKQLMDEGHTIKTKYNDTPHHVAARYNQAIILADLIAQNPQALNIENKFGSTPLLSAINKRCKETEAVIRAACLQEPESVHTEKNTTIPGSTTETAQILLAMSEDQTSYLPYKNQEALVLEPNQFNKSQSPEQNIHQSMQKLLEIIKSNALELDLVINSWRDNKLDAVVGAQKSTNTDTGISKTDLEKTNEPPQKKMRYEASNELKSTDFSIKSILS